MGPHEGDEAVLVEGHAGRALSLGDAVAVEHEQVAAFEARALSGVPRAVEHPEGDAALAEAFEFAVAPADEPRQMSRVDRHEIARRGVDVHELQRDEARRGCVARDLDVEAVDERFGVEAFVEQRAQHGEQDRHQQGRRAALARDIAQRDDDPAVGPGENVVEIAADGIGRARDAEGVETAAGIKAARQHGLLDVSGYLEIVLERQPLEDLEDDEKREAGNRENEPGRAGRPLRRGQREAEHERIDRDPHGVKAVEQPHHSDDGRREGHGEQHAPGGRHLHGDGQEEPAGKNGGAFPPGQGGEGLAVDGVREVAVSIAGVAGEEALEGLGREPPGIDVVEVADPVGLLPRPRCVVSHK